MARYGKEGELRRESQERARWRGESKMERREQNGEERARWRGESKMERREITEEKNQIEVKSIKGEGVEEKG